MTTRNGFFRVVRRSIAATAGGVLLTAGLLGVSPASAATPTQTTVTFNYNGSTGSDGQAQIWTVPAHVFSAIFQVAGAAGGGVGGGAQQGPGSEGQGGIATTTLSVTPGEVFTIYVGGTPTSQAGGFNGGAKGGDGGPGDTLNGGGASGAGGGGASDVRVSPYGLNSRTIIGGGGGGAGGGGNSGQGGNGGGGGGISGGNGAAGVTGYPSTDQGGGGGGQSSGGTAQADGDPGPPAPGALFVGGGGEGGCDTGSGAFASANGGSGGGGGGGGGFYGGGGGASTRNDCGLGGAGGGGGSGFGPRGTIFLGSNSGNGFVQITFSPSVADLAVGVGASPGTVVSGSTLMYSATVTNAGPSIAVQPTLQDALPSTETLVSETTSPEGSCAGPAAGQTGTISCQFANMASGASATLTFVVNVNAAAGTTVSDTITTSALSMDPNPANDSATVTTNVIAPIPTTTALSTAANPAIYGQNVNVTATVAPAAGASAPAGTAAPNGSVTFSATSPTSGTTTLGTTPLTGGSATFGVSTWAVGSDTITAVYSGDSNWAGSSGNVTETVQPITTTTTLSSSASPASYGQTLNITGSVAATSGSMVPSGTVTFTQGSNTLGGATLSGGAATITTSTLPVGSDTITASYSGDSAHAGSTTTLTEKINPATTSLSAAATTVTAANFSATLTSKVTGAGLAGQTVVFSTRNPLTGGTDKLCSATTGSTGVAACHGTVSFLDRSDKTYTASFAGKAPDYFASSAIGAL